MLKIELDSGGIGEMLRSDGVRAAVDAAASAVRSIAASDPAVTTNGATADQDSYTTDRAAAGVGIPHPAGLAIEAKHGTLTRAAAAAGLEVNSRR